MNRIKLLVVAALATPLAAQIIPVSGGGLALATAVAAAPNGAVLVVAAGTYDPVFAVNRHLTLVAPQRATIRSTGNGASLMWVTGLSAAQPFTMAGFDFVQGTTNFGHVSGRIQCRNAHIEDCTSDSVSVTAGMLRIARCTITAPDGGAVEATQGATVVIVDSTLWSGVCCANNPWVPQHAASTIYIDDSSLRAERIQVQASTTGFQSGHAVELRHTGTVPRSVTIADSVLLPGAPAPVPGLSIACNGSMPLTVRNTQAPGGTNCTVGNSPLTTLRWLNANWTPGGTSALRIDMAPSTLALGVISLSAVPFVSPLVAEISFVGATPDWDVHTVGISNPLGEFLWSVTLPASPSLLYASAWLHGVSIPGFPLNVSAPLAGLIR